MRTTPHADGLLLRCHELAVRAFIFTMGIAMNLFPTPGQAQGRFARIQLMLICSAVAWMTACASVPVAPTPPMLSAQAAITSAASAGAADWAPADLRLARDKLAQAQAAHTADHPQAAQRLAQEALADANLAEAKARSAKAQKTAADLGEGNRVLREELQRPKP